MHFKHHFKDATTTTMDKHIIIVCALLSLMVSFGSCSLHQPFTKGNLLALKKSVTPVSDGSPCTTGGFVEFTPDGQIVQEVLLPTEPTDNQACFLFTGDYNSRTTISTEGYRVIIPCCNPALESGQSYLSFAIVHGDGVFETTPILNNSLNQVPINAVLDGMDIWYQANNNIYYVLGLPEFTNSTQIFSGSLFFLQIHEGNLYVSNFEGLPGSIAQVGTGLPKEPTDIRRDIMEHNDVNYFTFIEDYVVLSLYLDGFNIYNFTSEQLVLTSSHTKEIVQFVPLFGQQKVIAHVVSLGQGLTPAIYSFSWNQTGIGTFDTATMLLNTTEDGFFYYSPTLVPITSCTDGVKNFEETDVDCGGSLCSQKCDGGKQCLTGDDCVTGGCTNNICDMPPSPLSTPSVVPSADPISQPTPIVAMPGISTSPISDTTNRPQSNLTSAASLLVASTASMTLTFLILF